MGDHAERIVTSIREQIKDEAVRRTQARVPGKEFFTTSTDDVIDATRDALAGRVEALREDAYEQWKRARARRRKEAERFWDARLGGIDDVAGLLLLDEADPVEPKS